MEDLPQNITENVTENVTEKETKIVELIMQNPFVTTSAMASYLSVTRMTISRIIKKLKEKGVVVRVNGDKGGYWKIIQKK